MAHRSSISRSTHRRVATSELQGEANLGTPLCPMAAFITNPKTKTCTVTSTGLDDVSLIDGKGEVNGTYAIVVQGDNPVDSPELVVQTGTFKGKIDFSQVLLGVPIGFLTEGGLTIDQAPGVNMPFTGTFRQPFAISEKGEQQEPRRGEEAFYLLDDGKLDRVRQNERAVGWPTVRFEITFRQ